MGVILPKPILSKVVDRAGSDSFAAGCCCVNGYRNTMEDAHCMVIGPDRLLFGVFDGHSNDRCSQFVSEHLPNKIMSQPLPMADAALEKICIDLDGQFLEDVGDGGTTATFCIVEPDAGSGPGKFKATVCNVGDSRTIIARDGKILFATADHKPQNPDERQRIERCGGSVRMNRVDGDLAVSRAFGDGIFKKNGSDLRNQKVIAVPDISRVPCQAGDVIILACDGVFEGSFTNEEVVEFVFKELPPLGGDYGVPALRVCDQAIRKGSKDNISCMIIHLTDGSSLTKIHGASSFVPGPPFPKTHEASRTAYTRMAQIAGVTLADALQQRYELYQAYVKSTLTSRAPVEQTAFEMSDDVDVDQERAFFGSGPSGANDKAFFSALAEGGR